MKKILSISLLVIFTVSTVGVIAGSYTCTMMKMKVNECCDKSNKSCCTHEVKLLKVKDDFVSSPVFSVPKNFTLIAVLISPPVLQNCFESSVSITLTTGISPPGCGVDRLSFIQSFLI